MFVLFIAHHVINRRWWAGLFKHKHAGKASDGHFDRKKKTNLVRNLNMGVNVVLAIYMILQPISGILLSLIYILYKDEFEDEDDAWDDFEDNEGWDDY